MTTLSQNRGRVRLGSVQFPLTFNQFTTFPNMIENGFAGTLYSSATQWVEGLDTKSCHPAFACAFVPVIFGEGGGSPFPRRSPNLRHITQSFPPSHRLHAQFTCFRRESESQISHGVYLLYLVLEIPGRRFALLNAGFMKHPSWFTAVIGWLQVLSAVCRKDPIGLMQQSR